MKDYDDELFSPEGRAKPPREKQGSGCSVWLIVLLIIGGICAICCCGIGIAAYSVVPKIEDNPAAAQQTLDDVMTIELAEGYEPSTSVEMNMFSLAKIRGAIIESEEKGFILIGSLSGQLAKEGNFIEEMQEGIETELDKGEVQIEESEIREFEIDKETVPFTFAKGKTEAREGQPAKEIRQVQATMAKGEETVLFLLIVDEENWNEEEVVRMIESISLE